MYFSLCKILLYLLLLTFFLNLLLNIFGSHSWPKNSKIHQLRMNVLNAKLNSVNCIQQPNMLLYLPNINANVATIHANTLLM